MEVLFIHSLAVQGMEVQVPVFMLVEGLNMISGPVRMTVLCYLRFSFSVRR